MREVGAFGAKNKLSALLDEVANGGEVIITRRRRPAARLVAPAAVDREAAMAAADPIVARSKGMTLEGASLKDLITEGRR